MYVLELAGQDDAFAAREAESAASGVELVGAGLATARGVTDRVRGLALTRRASALLGTTDPSIESARVLLAAAGVERSGTVAVRAVDVRGTTGIDTQRAERVLGSELVDRGFAVDLDDPDHELRALFSGPPGDDAGDAGAVVTDADGDGPAHASGDADSDGATRTTGDANGEAGSGAASEDGICALGWLAVESRREFDRRPTDRPFFQPGSMQPLLARALVNVAGAREGATVVDPMCGTGGLLVEAGLVGARVVGADAQSRMVRGTRRNLAAELDGRFDVVRADARRLPLVDGAVDAAVVDVPYGRQSKIEAESLATLVGDALAELRRVAPRAVVVGDRSWADAARGAGWTVDATFERRVHRSLVRYVHVLV